MYVSIITTVDIQEINVVHSPQFSPTSSQNQKYNDKHRVSNNNRSFQLQFTIQLPDHITTQWLNSLKRSSNGVRRHRFAIMCAIRVNTIISSQQKHVNPSTTNAKPLNIAFFPPRSLIGSQTEITGRFRRFDWKSADYTQASRKKIRSRLDRACK